MSLEQRVDYIDRDLKGVRTELSAVRKDVQDLRVDMSQIKATIPFLATKNEVTSSRDVIICWLIGLYVATGLYSHFPITLTHNGSSQPAITQPATNLVK